MRALSTASPRKPAAQAPILWPRALSVGCPKDRQNWQLLYGQSAEYKAWFEEMWANQGKYQIPVYGVLSTSPAWIDYQATSNDLVERSFLEIVRAETPEAASALFDDFVATWLSAGGEAAQAEMNELLKQVYQ